MSAKGKPADVQLLQATREVARLLRERRRHQRRLKEIKHDLRLARAELRALISRLAADTGPDVAPSRLFGGAVGIDRGTVARPRDIESRERAAADAFVDGLEPRGKARS